jgi:hypothetical protein
MPTQTADHFDIQKNKRRGNQIAAARLNVQSATRRLNEAFPSRPWRGDRIFVVADSLSGTSVPSPVLIAVYDRKTDSWELKVGSVVEANGRIEVNEADGIPLLDCPTNLLVHFGLGDELPELVYSLRIEMAASE